MRNHQVCCPQKLNELSKLACDTAEQWKRMLCTNDSRSTLTYEKLEQIRAQIESEIKYLHDSGYVTAYSSDTLTWYAIDADEHCPLV